MSVACIRRVCTVVWADPIEEGYDLLLECGHRAQRATEMCETVCFCCPAIAPGERPDFLAMWSLIAIETTPS